ncbi:MAG TPA: hypothetical protein VFP80_03275 [Thermoanaerobaculia bacterium]|nr:hypothetical protein [Thermoanaerobaculia bacterium]
MKKSRLFTLILAGVAAGVSHVKPEWGGLLYAALGVAGWALPHPADKAK